MIHAFHTVNADLDSHFSYLSGLLLGIGVAFLFCIAAVRRPGNFLPVAWIDRRHRWDLPG